MIILHPEQDQNIDSSPNLILMFGIGLLGSAVFKHISKKCGKYQAQYHGFDWHDAAKRSSQAVNILNIAKTIMSHSGASFARVSFVWLAGSGGFNSSQQELDNENKGFQTVVDIATELKLSSSNVTVEFHHISSAGGLFEGCGYVDNDTRPDPQRPYGRLKLLQEKLLLNQNVLTPRIYRPSTVYGQVLIGKRQGLISTLIRNGSLKKVTDIQGNLYTLRDYVFASDIADFISDAVLTSGNLSEQSIFFLISGKPSSIYEVISVIEHILKNKLYYKLHFNPQNSKNIAFSSSLLPKNWRQTNLGYGIKKIYYDFISPQKTDSHLT